MASALLKLDKDGPISNQKMAEFLGNINPVLLRRIIEPCIECGIVSEENGLYVLESPDQLDLEKTKNTLITAERYLQITT